MNTQTPQFETVRELVDALRQIAPHAQLCIDSRKVQAGDIFFAFRVAGGAGDGRNFIESAIKSGAIVVVYEPENFVWTESKTAVGLEVSDLANKIGVIANAWFKCPDQEMLSVAITGTNGKTSCSQWIAHALSNNDRPTAAIGTLGIALARNGQFENIVETGLTTPDALQLQTQLANLKNLGARALAIEASSIGLVQGRLRGLHVDIALFTNLTRDHLDFHGNIENYFAAKASLFARAELKAAVINLDDEFGEALAKSLQERTNLEIITYSLNGRTLQDTTSLQADHIQHSANGCRFRVTSRFGEHRADTRLTGAFNVSNALGVLGVLIASKLSWEAALKAIEVLESAPGRMQRVGYSAQTMVIVDYAHTPDALEKTIAALKPIAQERRGELWCVFGCGGDRDPGKRPQMGRIAESAEHVIVTSDNPRTENPSQIIDDIVHGMLRPPHVIEDRAKAILYAIKHAKVNDVVLIAGKGHEAYQEINGKRWSFSDQAHAELALASVARGSMSSPSNLRGE